MTLSSAEQYLLELMNRARLDPLGEAARFGIDLNQGLAPGTLTGAAKQVLAPNALLEAAATGHSLWMLANDVFSHTGAGGSDPGQRIAAQGYTPLAWGENLAYVGSTDVVTVEGSIDALNENLFLSATHRSNLMNGSYREVGLGTETGIFTSGRDYNAVMLTEDFGLSGAKRFLTGVCYADRDNNDFYSIGEGRGGVTFTIGTGHATSAAAGGYALSAGLGSATAVTGKVGTLVFSLSVDMSHGNVELDLVNGNTFESSGNTTLVSGIRNIDLLGAGNLNATGGVLGNHLTGNSGSNVLAGRGGNDVLSGLAGNDVLKAGDGNDVLTGGAGNDTMMGEGGADTFVFSAGFGKDRVTDFSLAQHDHLSLSSTLWTGTQTATDVVSHFAHVGVGEVVFDFGGGNEIHLAGLTTLTGLDASILIL